MTQAQQNLGASVDEAVTHHSLGQLLNAARMKLRRAEIDNADMDARLLVQALSGCSLTDLVVRTDMVVAAGVQAQVEVALQRRIAGEPVHRILGEREFYGLQFSLNTDTLEPRPDTEVLIELVLPFLRQRTVVNGVADLLDMGTGSGAIAVTLLHEVPEARGVAVDIAAGALNAVRINARRAGVTARLACLHSDWFTNVRGQFDLIVSNPPYIPQQTVLELAKEVKDYDPRIALDGGADGLNFYRSLAQNCGQYLNEDGMVAVEIGAGQETDVTAIFAKSGLQLTGEAEDLAGHKRALAFQH